MSCKPWKHKWRLHVGFITPTGQVCGKCGFERARSYAERKAWHRRIAAIRALPAAAVRPDPEAEK